MLLDHFNKPIGPLICVPPLGSSGPVIGSNSSYIFFNILSLNDCEMRVPFGMNLTVAPVWNEVQDSRRFHFFIFNAVCWEQAFGLEIAQLKSFKYFYANYIKGQ